MPIVILGFSLQFRSWAGRHCRLFFRSIGNHLPCSAAHRIPSWFSGFHSGHLKIRTGDPPKRPGQRADFGLRISVPRKSTRNLRGQAGIPPETGRSTKSREWVADEAVWPNRSPRPAPHLQGKNREIVENAKRIWGPPGPVLTGNDGKTGITCPFPCHQEQGIEIQASGN